MRQAIQLCVAILTLTVALPSFAQSSPIIDRYFATLDMGQVFEILHDEGIAAGQDLANDDQSVSNSPSWRRQLERIYTTDRARDLFTAALETSADLQSSDAALTFFETDLGRKIIDLELTARRAMADDAVIDKLTGTLRNMKADNPDRLALYDRFIDVNSLVDSNVSGALNSNLAFYRGMATQPQFADTLNEDFMLSTVWAQEAEIRGETQDWTLQFAALAYDTLTDAELRDYIDMSTTPAGRKLNAALFSGFNAVFEAQSYDLGRAMAEFSVGEDT